MKKWAVIVAGGSGTRMKSEIPKQFIEIGGRPILMHTLEAFHSAFSSLKLILVLPEIQIPFWRGLCEKHKFEIKHQIVKGGIARFHSVKNGLNAIHSAGLVAIHDGVRPFISAEIIKNSFKLAGEMGNAVASVPLKDSLRKVNANGTNELVNREEFQLVQTPQTFQIDLIKKAFETEYDPSFTDDASVLERLGLPIHLIDGDYRNIKITTTEDLFTAEAMLSNQ
ncbi:MAG: 2-C-methyl-D-erythritol 4-phosphate cytidylyltransferase [Cytophagales bacterium CG12_big_fil_rev_8_21_14_0_65_40_12]|nr:MAG: 2-C-methyl-D-erythritol 4-phosphate cytidylyltransferase [Cytophagales bacterium CG12_big_fil_rev_8_21_14_0_65_40_12]PIW03423.1 MAG: 2-C-methyl-D-erythritol 4-phosphate cytidylyltransferase [Cytophagales bacterium CG17_big_fil_post_rev_8_21_14_2_50_40_13]